MNDTEIVSCGLAEFNRYIKLHKVPVHLVAEYRKRRRTIKNRLYQAASRAKKRSSRQADLIAHLGYTALGELLKAVDAAQRFPPPARRILYAGALAPCCAARALPAFVSSD